MLDKIIRKITKKENLPKAIQCLWYSDTNYLALHVELVFKNEKGYFKEKIAEFDYIDFKDEEKIIKEGKTIGKIYSEKYNIEFYFPSPNAPLNDCPQWWNSKNSLKCEDCDTPIEYIENNYLSKEICYSCNLKRENIQKIKKAELYEEGSIYVCLKDKNTIERISHHSEFKYLPIARFIDHKTSENKLSKTISTLILNKKDIEELIRKLEIRINKDLSEHIKPNKDNCLSKFNTIRSIDYNGITYELNRGETYELISSYNTANKAIKKNFEYIIYFKNGINYRDDSFLRFIHYVKKGKVKKSILKDEYRDFLTEYEIELTIQKLIKIECLSSDKNDILITEKGKNII